MASPPTKVDEKRELEMEERIRKNKEFKERTMQVLKDLALKREREKQKNEEEKERKR